MVAGPYKAPLTGWMHEWMINKQTSTLRARVPFRLREFEKRAQDHTRNSWDSNAGRCVRGHNLDCRLFCNDHSTPAPNILFCQRSTFGKAFATPHHLRTPLLPRSPSSPAPPRAREAPLSNQIPRINSFPKKR